jgi:hypothetical protein
MNTSISPPHSRSTPTVRSTLALGEYHNIQFVEFMPGASGVIQTGRATVDTPAMIHLGHPPPEAGEARSGEDSESKFADVRTTPEQDWFRQTFCNGAQTCLQGWDWAFHVSNRQVGTGAGIAMVGSEGTVNATFLIDYWECFCGSPFCVGGPTCLWINFWSGLVLPGHWLSVDVTAHSRYIRWRLEGAGGGTQVSLAARY